MAAIWLYHGFYMDTIRPAYGLAIWNTFGVSGANHIYAHMPAIWLHIWHTYGWHMTMLLGMIFPTVYHPRFACLQMIALCTEPLTQLKINSNSNVTSIRWLTLPSPVPIHRYTNSTRSVEYVRSSAARHWSYRYLGVLLSDDLQWSKHVQHGENCVFNFSLHCLELTVRFLWLNARR